MQLAFAALSETTVFDRSLQTLNAAVSSLIAPENPVLSSLQGIGINSQITLLSATRRASVTLSIDQNVLVKASRLLVEQSAGIKAQIVETSIFLNDLSQSALSSAQQRYLATVLGLSSNLTLPLSSVGVDLLDNLTVDLVLNDLELSDLDLAKVGLDAAIILSDDGVLRESLAAASPLSSTSASNPPVEELLASAGNRIPGGDLLSNVTLEILLTAVNLTTPVSLASATDTPPAPALACVPNPNTITVTNQGVSNIAVEANTDSVQADRSLSISRADPSGSAKRFIGTCNQQ